MSRSSETLGSSRALNEEYEKRHFFVESKKKQWKMMVIASQRIGQRERLDPRHLMFITPTSVYDACVCAFVFRHFFVL